MGSVENILENKQKHLDKLIDRVEGMMAGYKIMGESRIQLEDYKTLTKDQLAERRQNKHRASYFDPLGRYLSMILAYLPGDNQALEAELYKLLDDVRRHSAETGSISEDLILAIDKLAGSIITKARSVQI